MPNWYLNSMGWIVSFLRYAALSLFWTPRGPKCSRPSFLWRVCGHQIRIQTNQTANMRKRVIREILSTFMKQRT